MGLKSSKESTVLSARKSVLTITGANISEDALCELLHWAVEHEFSADPDTAFSLQAWQQLGDKLIHEVVYGDKNVVGLVPSWGSLFDIPQRWTVGGERKELPGSEGSEGEGSEGDNELSEGGQTQESTGRASPASSPAPLEPERVAETAQRSYPSPRNYVPPICPSPREFHCRTRHSYSPSITTSRHSSRDSTTGSCAASFTTAGSDGEHHCSVGLATTRPSTTGPGSAAQNARAASTTAAFNSRHNGAATCPHSVQVFFHKCAHSAWLSCARACIRVSSCAGADSPATNGGPLGAASYSSAGGVAAAGSTAGGVAAGDCCQTRARATQTSAAAATAEAAAAPEAVAEGPAAVPARTVALPQVDTSLPSTQVSTASAAMPSSGRAPVPCQPSSSALKPSEIPLPDDASSDTEETPAPRQKTEVAARRRQPVRRLFQSRPWTLPEFNNAKPVKRYQWKVLPQGVKNSPTVCQCLQARSTCPERKSGYGIYSQVGRPM
ncbi:endochitinase A-like [Corvus moneduloides]|uniref:endochitinase A-like n=1 Tax=Corvus moneduloides TaxID=1196302 RepID=UPI0013627E5D|nr:endochitinase A-like [Corvus moneduloides]